MDLENYIPTYSGHSYAELPMEILIEIFSYLEKGDLYACSMTCHHWFEATQHQSFVSKTAIMFLRLQLHSNVLPMSIFLKNLRDYKILRLIQADFGDTTEFWEHFSDSIEDILIKDSEIREKTLAELLIKLKKLKSLSIDNCRELFMTGRLLENVIEIPTCRNITSLSLTNNRYLSDALFHRFLALMPQIRSLDLSGCHISFHKGLYKKFYPEGQKSPSESVLTFSSISKFIKNQAFELKQLNFSSTLIDGSALSSLSKIPNLKLEVLTLTTCEQLTYGGITDLCFHQPSLQELDFSFSARLTDSALLRLIEAFPRLKVLKLRRCRALTDLILREIYKLKELRVLDVSEIDVLAGLCANGFAREKQLNLREMYLSALAIDENDVIAVAQNAPNLRILDLSFCKRAATDNAIHAVFKHLPLLRMLNLEYCDMISDAAITGMKMQDNDTENNSTLEKNDEMPQTSRGRGRTKISLRSKAEQSIVDDAKRIKDMIEMYENNKIPLEQIGDSIDNLKGLHILNLKGCIKITDVSLKYSLKLRELQEISLSKCQQISTIGLTSLVKNCPSLEALNLSECHNIDDKTIKIVTESLKRLTHLYLERCIQLTDYSLDYISMNCVVLKYLDVRGCRSMSFEPGLRLANLKSLHQVLFSKPGPYLTTKSKRQSRPPPPPPPPKFLFF